MKDLEYGEGRVIYFAENCYPADERIREEYGKMLHSLASDILSDDLASGWLRSPDKVSYTVWEHEWGRTFYLLNIDGRNDGQDRTAVWSCGGKDFAVPVRRYMIETIYQNGNLAVMPLSGTSDILCIKETGTGWSVTVQTTGPDILKVMNAATGEIREIRISAPGIHDILLIQET